jgi:hypothetical protein
MALRKCPKCELNYIKDDEQYCNVCLRELKTAVSHHKQEDEDEEIIMCTECGEAPAVRGSDLCAECLKEAKRQTELENAADLDVGFDEDEDGEPQEEEEE